MRKFPYYMYVTIKCNKINLRNSHNLQGHSEWKHMGHLFGQPQTIDCLIPATTTTKNEREKIK